MSTYLFTPWLHNLGLTDVYMTVAGANIPGEIPS